ncbi:Integrator complex subunit 3 [Zea mays]|uniref:Integrator complex subunit 3 n=1 Tax=Zea mays TaxID=4577 RepID=A0A3L6E5P7_MAIZE|nr:Integrator complex subunit 3 [Zea mays]
MLPMSVGSAHPVGAPSCPSRQRWNAALVHDEQCEVGDQKRYQLWFARKHLMVPGGEERIPDIVRFICCGHHPTNEVMKSGVIARWAVVGWLLTSCSKGYVVANVKLALFYDWLFFEDGMGSVMNIEPAMLLMVNSVSQYADITNMLLEFLFLLIDNYDVQRKEVIAHCVRSAFGVLVKKGVVPSLEPLTGCDKLSPLLRQKLLAFYLILVRQLKKLVGRQSMGFLKEQS